jgi:diaminohydroxyphosphoribosylaminopyrimidine deaminase/5-amino-6-(5-phosphoribosylamino)uracil reductase
MTDLEFMQRALSLAERGSGKVSPNPAVGAVLVKDGKIVGEGFHQYEQRLHAEVIACEQAGEAASRATLYVNLEPCAHQGRTPPCCDYLAAKKIGRVVSAMQDPNPLVSGRGFERLRQAGIAVEVGVLGAEAAALNEAYTKFIRERIPFVTIKTAMSLDGKITSARRQGRELFTGPESNAVTEKLRLQADAIAVGSASVLTDDPLLTYRGPEKRRRPLVRVLLDPHGRVGLDRRLFEEPPPIWWVRPPLQLSLPDNITLIHPESGHAETWRRVLQRMAEEGMYHLLIEGGGETNASALGAGIVDKLLFAYTPKILGGRTTIGPVGGEGFCPPLEVNSMTAERIGSDIWIHAYLR